MVVSRSSKLPRRCSRGGTFPRHGCRAASITGTYLQRCPATRTPSRPPHHNLEPIAARPYPLCRARRLLLLLTALVILERAFHHRSPTPLGHLQRVVRILLALRRQNVHRVRGTHMRRKA